MNYATVQEPSTQTNPATALGKRAHELIQHGISVVPVAPGMQKRPLGAWKQWQSTIPTPGQVDAMFADPTVGLGIVTGAVSGNLEMLEIEAAGIGRILDIEDLARASGLASLWARLVTGWEERSPSGGYHWFYRVEAPIAGNTKLACNENNVVMAETRGEGGFVVAAPTGGEFHATGEPWLCVGGGPETVPTITVTEREALHSLFASIGAPRESVDRQKTSTESTSSSGWITRPGDDFEERTDWAEILTPHGWKETFANKWGRFWQRPEKTIGVSASTGYANDRDRLYVFTTSSVFTPETPYTKFAAYALLNHGGDHKRAAADLAEQGYGKKASADRPRLTLVSHSASMSLPESRTDVGTAEMVAERFAETLRYVSDMGKWASWVETRWVVSPDDAPAVQAVLETVEAWEPDSSEEWKHKQRSLSYNTIASVVRMLRNIPFIRMSAAVFDSRGLELNTPDGVIDLTTGKSTKALPSMFHTRQSAVAQDTSLETPKWDRFLHVTFGGDEEMIDYVQRLAGLSAIGHVSEHVLPFLYGSGGNGKTVFLETLQSVLGDYATCAPYGFLIAGRDRHDTELANLMGRRLVVAAEVNENSTFDEAKIKALTGGDKIAARFMRQDYFTFTPTHTLWLMGNNQPKVTTGGESFWRRLRLIPFTHTVTEAERIDGLQQQLVREEGPGILAWIIQGAIEAEKHGCEAPGRVRDATTEYAEQEDHVGRFLTERCHMGGGSAARVLQPVLRGSYEKWCLEEGVEELTRQSFGRRLKSRHGIETLKSSGRKYYTGLTLYRAEDDEQPDTHWSDR